MFCMKSISLDIVSQEVDKFSHCLSPMAYLVFFVFRHLGECFVVSVWYEYRVVSEPEKAETVFCNYTCYYTLENMPLEKSKLEITRDR